jgi:glycerophosphoryl diester phosphodiesterase
VVTPQYIDSLRNAGIDQFHVWTVDDAEQAKYYREQGAWGITTNRPAFIRNALTDTLQEIPT